MFMCSSDANAKVILSKTPLFQCPMQLCELSGQKLRWKCNIEGSANGNKSVRVSVAECLWRLNWLASENTDQMMIMKAKNLSYQPI